MNAHNRPVQRVTPGDYVDRFEGRPPPWRRPLVERAGSFVTLGTSGRHWWIASPRHAMDRPTVVNESTVCPTCACVAHSAGPDPCPSSTKDAHRPGSPGVTGDDYGGTRQSVTTVRLAGRVRAPH
jgi:hypothetical protein